nr:hypothetical protein [Tanacetum cinerariifolium]
KKRQLRNAPRSPVMLIANACGPGLTPVVFSKVMLKALKSAAATVTEAELAVPKVPPAGLGLPE